MFCKNCGTQIPEGSGVCVNCGTAAQTPAAPVQPDTSNQETVVFSAVPETPAPAPAAKPTPAPAAKPAKKKSSVVPIIIIALVLVGLLLGGIAIAVAVFVFGNSTEDTISRRPIHSQVDTGDEDDVDNETRAPKTEISKSNLYYDDFISPDSYTLSDSNARYYSRAELAGMTRAQLYLAEREMFARHGGTFQDGDLDEFFNSKSWYIPDSPADNFNESLFSDTERVNLLLLRALLMERDGTASSNPYTKINSHVEGFILPYTDSTRIKKADVQDLDEKELIIAYSEIYARKGYIFEDNDLQVYFSGKNWYTPSTLPGSFNKTAELNEIEQDNYACLQQCYEKLKGVRFSSSNKYKDCYNYYSEYICPESSHSVLSPWKLKDMDAEELMIARNEIYARYGYAYNDAHLKEYFMNRKWYFPTVANGKLSLIDLTDTEEKNVKMIQAFELNLKLRKGEGTVNTKMSYYAKHDYMTMYLPEHWRDHCVCVKPTGLSGNLEFYEKYNKEDGYGGWVFTMALVPTSQSIPSYSGENVSVYGYVTTSSGDEYYVLLITPIYREDAFLDKIYETMTDEVDTIMNSIEWKSGYSFTRA